MDKKSWLDISARDAFSLISNPQCNSEPWKKAFLFRNRVRAIDAFIDFDKLRTGRITRINFLRALKVNTSLAYQQLNKFAPSLDDMAQGRRRYVNNVRVRSVPVIVYSPPAYIVCMLPRVNGDVAQLASALLTCTLIERSRVRAPVSSNTFQRPRIDRLTRAFW